MVYKIIIALKEENQKEELIEACKSFIRRIKNLIDDGAIPKNLYDSCMIVVEIYGIVLFLKVPVVIELSKRIGILNPDDGSFIRNPPSDMSEELEKEAVLDVYVDSILSRG